MVLRRVGQKLSSDMFGHSNVLAKASFGVASNQSIKHNDISVGAIRGVKRGASLHWRFSFLSNTSLRETHHIFTKNVKEIKEWKDNLPIYFNYVFDQVHVSNSIPQATTKIK